MRRFGDEISGNRRHGGELSEEQRTAILYGLQSKQSPTQITHQLRVSRRVIYTTRDRYLNHKTVASKPRSSRPSKLNTAAKHYIYLIARRRPQITYKALAATSSPSISKQTIQRILRKYNLKK